MEEGEALIPNIIVDEINILGCGKPIINGAAYNWMRQVEVVLDPATANRYGTLYYKVYFGNGSLGKHLFQAQMLPKSGHSPTAALP